MLYHQLRLDSTTKTELDYTPSVSHAPSLSLSFHTLPRATKMSQPHFLVVACPAQGHINPSVHFAKRLIRCGARVTFAISVSAIRRMAKTPAIDGLDFAPFSDGYDDGFKQGDDAEHYMAEIKRRGTQSVRDLIVSNIDSGRPFDGLVYSILLPWAGEVARELHVPSALLWIQPAAVLDMYYYYFNGFAEVIREKLTNDPSSSIEFPGLPLKFTSRDLPSFVVPSNVYTFTLPSFKEHFETLDRETAPKILVNTFDALEPHALRAIKKYNVVGIGPLVPSAFLGGSSPCDASSGVDLFQANKDYLQWLNSKPAGSVTYVSFGSIAELSKQQAEELGRALIETNRPFMWVIRAKEKSKKEDENQEDQISCMEELEQRGMIVPWCSQLEVLSHPSLGCFVTHCGWNSTLESIVLGVPVVAFPQWTDQGTNAKMIEDVWKVGVRVRANEEGIVEVDEIKRCLEMVMVDGERKEELRKNALKWKNLAIEAAEIGGPSDMNLKAFIEEVAASS